MRATPAPDSPRSPFPAPQNNITLVELLDRVIEKGVMLSGDLVISVADIDLLYVGLRALVCSADRLPEWSPLRRP